MSFWRSSILALVAVLIVGVGSVAQTAPVEIEFLHAFSGSREAVLQGIVDDFNVANPDIHVNAVFGGSKIEVFNAATTRFRTGNQPHIIQAESTFGKTLVDGDVIIPAYLLAEQTGVEVAWDDLLGPLYDYFSQEGKLYGVPFSTSTAILFFNRDIFEAAGLNPDQPPATWAELDVAARQIKASGVVEHVIQAVSPSWSLLENLFPYHSQWAFDKSNGHDGFSTVTYFNNEMALGLLELCTTWVQDGIFEYEGRRYEPVPTFISGGSAFLIGSISSLASILESSEFAVGTTFLPRLDGYPRGLSTIGGDILFAFRGFSEVENAATMKFLAHLMDCDVTIRWHKGTGYFPLTNTAVQKLFGEGWFENQNQLTALLQLFTGSRTEQTRSPLVGNFSQIRSTLDAALEEAFSGAKTPKQALDDAARKINNDLKDYARIYN